MSWGLRRLGLPGRVAVLVLVGLATAAGSVVASDSAYRLPQGGLAMVADELRDLYSFVPLEDGSVLTLSRARDRRLIVGRLTLQGVFDVLLRLDEDTSALVRSPNAAELGVHSHSPDGTTRALLLYRLDYSSAYRVRNEVWLQTLILDAAGRLAAAPAEKVGEIAYETKGQEPSSQWWFAWPSPTDPALWSDARVLSRDVDRDGELDLVVWVKRCLSRPKTDSVDWARAGQICPPGFRLDRWVAHAELATRAGWTVGPLREAPGLDVPTPDQWDGAFGWRVSRGLEP